MAILTADELQASREAIEAGVNTVSDADVDVAIRRAEALLNLALGYKVKNDAGSVTFTSRDVDTMVIPERVRSLSAISESYRGGPASSVTQYELRGGGFEVHRTGRWRDGYTVTLTGQFGYAADDDRFILAQQFVLKAAVRDLARGTVGGFPTPQGAYLTGYASEGAQFQFYTPEDVESVTGYKDLDDLLDQIGRHPSKGRQSLWTMSLSRGERELGPEAIFMGIDEEPP